MERSAAAGTIALTDLDEMRRLGLHSIQSLCRVTTCMTQPHSQNLSDWAGITGISSQVASAVLVIWKLLGCLSSGEAKSGLTCPIPRLLSSPGLLDVEIVCKALSLLWTMDMFDMFFPGTEHGSQTVSMSNRRLIIRILVSS